MNNQSIHISQFQCQENSLKDTFQSRISLNKKDASKLIHDVKTINMKLNNKSEENNIEKTILSVIEQTVKPVKWIIVNDGSTDNTREIIEKYLDQYQFISLINRKKSFERNFS